LIAGCRCTIPEDRGSGYRFTIHDLKQIAHFNTGKTACITAEINTAAMRFGAKRYLQSLTNTIIVIYD